MESSWMSWPASAVKLMIPVSRFRIWPISCANTPATSIAFSRRVVIRSLVISAIVGSLLIAINHGFEIAHGSLDSTCYFQCGLTLLVPYCVSTVSCVLTILEQKKV